MNVKTVLTKEQEEKMYGMIEKGIPDTEIAKKMNIRWHFVQSASTKYRNDKMKNK